MNYEDSSSNPSTEGDIPNEKDFQGVELGTFRSKEPKEKAPKAKPVKLQGPPVNAENRSKSRILRQSQTFKMPTSDDIIKDPRLSLYNTSQPNTFRPSTTTNFNLKFKTDAVEKTLTTTVREVVSNDLEVMYRADLQRCLQAMDYLPYLKQDVIDAQQLFDGQKNIHQVEIQQAYLFFDAFWVYLNPLYEEKIDTHAFISVMGLLMNNVSSNEGNLLQAVAECLLEHYQTLGLNFKHEPSVDSSDNSGSQEIFKKSFTKPLVDVSEYIGLSDPQIVTKFVQSKLEVMSLQKFIKAFKHDHAERFAFRVNGPPHFERTNHTSVMQLSSNRRLADSLAVNKSLKADTLRDLAQTYTFTPKTNTKSTKLAKQRQKRMVETLNKDSKGERAAEDQIQQPQPVDRHEQRYRISLYLQEQKQAKLQELKKQGEQTTEECTFSPKLIKPISKFQNVPSKVREVARAKSQMSARAPLSSQMKFAQRLIQEKRLQEEEECTFKPKMYTQNRPKSAMSSKAAGQAALRQATSQEPKGFAKTVERLRNFSKDKQELDRKVQRQSIGQRYTKAKLAKLQPPKFLLEESKDAPRWKKQPIVTLDIRITPKK